MNDLSNNLIISKDDSKRERKHNAIKLPPEIKESMIPKYVVYYKECYNREKQQFREFFKIEKHPKNTNKKTYTSSKSTKIGILEKLDQIKKLLVKIDTEYNEQTNDQLNDQLNDQPNEQSTCEDVKKSACLAQLPKYVSLKKCIKNEKDYYLIYDKKTHEDRKTFRTLCNNNFTLLKNVELFLEKVKEKYNELYIVKKNV